MVLIWTTVPDMHMPPGRAGVRTGILSATALMRGEAVVRELRRLSSWAKVPGVRTNSIAISIAMVDVCIAIVGHLKAWK